MTTPRLRAHSLALAAAALGAFPGLAYANAGWAFVYLGVGFFMAVLATLAIETPLVRWCMKAGWWAALGATAFANLVSFILGLVANVAVLGDPERLREVALFFANGPGSVVSVVVLIISIAVVIGAAIEVAVIWLVSLGRMSLRAAAILFAANAFLSGIGAAGNFKPEDYQKVSDAEVTRLETYYESEIVFMRDTLADLPRVWTDEAIVVVDGEFVYPEYEQWLEERKDAITGLRFVSLTVSGFTPRDRPKASITPMAWDLFPPLVQSWEGHGVRVDRAARRYKTIPRPGPTETAETYRYVIKRSVFTITGLFDPPA